MKKKAVGIALAIIIIGIIGGLTINRAGRSGRKNDSAEKKTVRVETDAAEDFTESETESEMEIPVLTREMMDETLYAGTWVAFDDLYALYIPLDWQMTEVSEENANAGVIFQAADTASETGINMVVMANQLSEDDGVRDLLDMKSQIEEAGNRGVEIDYINNIPVVSYVTDYSYGLSFVNASNGIMYTVQIGPCAESVQPYAHNIMLSLSLVIDEEETDETEW